MSRLPLFVDWDDTLVGIKDGEWLPGAKEFLKFAGRQNWHPTVFSSKANYAAGYEQIRSMLDAARFGDVPIVGKPAAFAYVDNRAAEFCGSWVETRAKVRLLAAS